MSGAPLRSGARPRLVVGAVASPIVRDPDVTRGRFRVLGRTDGCFIVFDPDRKLGENQVGVPLRTLDEAVRVCTLVAEREGEAKEKRGAP